MSIFFSPSTRGFYLSALHGEAMPADVQRITAARHARLLEDQAAGAEIVATPRGPIAHFPKVGLADIRAAAIAAVKRQARTRILAIAPHWRQLNDVAAIATAALQLGATMTTNVDVDAALGRRRAIDGIRAASGRIEERLAAMTAAELEAFDPGDDTHWSDQHEG